MTKKTIHQGKWLNFNEVSFTNSRGESRQWEFASRTTPEGAACVIAVLEDKVPRVVLIKQFRPPIDTPVLEFPAGLVDPGESLETAALRELQEESGFVGEVLSVGPPVYSSPGLCDESVSLVRVRVTGRSETRPEADESIQTLVLPLTGLLDELVNFQAKGVKIDAKLWSFALGLSWSASRQ